MKASAITAAALLALTAQTVSAADAVGYNVVTVPANSDVLVSVPFNQKAVGSFTVVSVTGSGVTVADTLQANAYTNGYYVRFTSGSGEGLWSTISANGTGGFDLQNTAVLAHVGNGNTFKVYPHQTLAKVFPDGMEGVSFEKSASGLNRKTEILIPGTSGVGINKSAASTYYYINNEWRRVGGGTANQDNTVLSPETFFVLRNRGVEELSYIASGNVESLALGRFVDIQTAKNDIPAVSGRPVPMTLAELGLGGTAAFETSASGLNRKDELLVFDNTATGQNKSAQATYYFISGQWRKVGGGTVNYNDQLVDAGAALIIRKAAAASAGSAEWNQTAPF